MSERHRPVDDLTQPFHEALISNIDGIVWECDAQTFGFSFVSKQAERILGHATRRWTEEPTFWIDHIHPDDREWAPTFCARATEERRDHTFEYRMIAADGRVVWLRDVVTVISKDGQPARLVGIMLDITEQKAAEARYARQEQETRALLNAIPDAIVRLNREGDYLDVKAPGDYEPVQAVDTLVGRNIYDLLPEALAHQCMHYVYRALESQQMQTFEYTIEVQGEPRTREARVVHAGPDEAIAIMRDITERKRSESALQQSEQRFRAIFNSMFQLIGLMKPDGTLIEVNQAALEFGGVKPEAVIGRKFWDTYWWAHDPQVQQELREAIAQASAGQFVRYNVEVRGQGARTATIDFSIKPVFDEDGQVTLLIPEGRDISENVQIKAEMARLRVAQDALRESETRYRALFQAAADAVLIYPLGPEGPGPFHDFNDAALELYGYEKDEFQKMTVFDLVQGSRAFINTSLVKLRLTGKARGESLHRAKDGRTIPMEVSARILQLDGKTMVVSLCRNITKRRQAEEKTARLAAIFESSEDAITRQTLKGIVTDWNPSAEMLYGYQADEVIGKSIAIITPEGEMVRVQRWMKEAAAGLPIRAHETMRRRRDGKLLPISLTLSPIRNTEGEVVALSSIERDISARKEAQDALRHSEELRRIALDAAQLGTWDWDLITDRIHWDPRCRAIFGYEEQEDIGFQEAMGLVVPEDRERMEERIAQALIPSGPGRYDEELQVKGRDGQVIWVAVTGRTIFEGEGGDLYPIRVVGTLQDITVRRSAEDALRNKTQVLQTVNHVNANLAAYLDIKTLVQTVTDAGTELTGAQYGAFFYNVIEEGEEGYMLYSISGADKEAFSEYPMPRNTDLFHETFTGQGVVRCDDVTKDERFGKNPPFEGLPEGHLPVTSYLAVPVTSHENEVIGGLFFGHETPGQFDVEDERIVQGIAKQAAIAIENARLFQVMQREIKVREEAEAALRENQQRLRFTLEAAQVGTWNFNMVEGTVEWSDNLEQIHGLPAGSFGNTFESFLEDVHPDDRGQVKETIEAAIMGDGIYHVEYRLPARGLQGHQWVEGKGRVTYDEEGQPVSMSGICTNITERKRAADALARAKQEAESANRAKSQFLANMSHELRTPLNAVIGYSELVEEELEDAGHDAFLPELQKIHTAGKQLLALVNDVLDLSKIEAGKNELQIESFDLATVLLEVETTIEPLAMKNNNTLQVRQGAGTERMHTDKLKLKQCLLNLLGNAVKFTEGGTVTLTVEALQAGGMPWLRFDVKDTGIGMTKEQREHLFESFYRGEDESRRRYEGTGLGLSITWRLCQLLGGSVEVDSERGTGTTFTMHLPAVLTEVEATPSLQQKADVAQLHQLLENSTGTGDRPLVLVVDDDDDARDLLAQFLSREGFATVKARDGYEGLRLARQLQPAAITIDVMMPGLDGWQVLSAIKNDPGLVDIPVIMVTIIGDERKAYTLGASEFMTKPVDRQRLATVLQRLCLQANSCRVLVVDDDESTCRLVRRTLERYGLDVEMAHNGKEALDMLGKFPPNVILLDLMMPEMDGFTLVDRLRREPIWRDIPVVVLTSKDLSDQERRRLSGGVEAVLQKGSYTREMLLQEVLERVKDCVEVDPNAVAFKQSMPDDA